MEQIWRILALFCAVIGCVNGGGIIENFTVSTHLAMPGTEIVFTYVVKEAENQPTTAYFKKHFHEKYWDMLDNDEKSESIQNDDRFVPHIQHNGDKEEYIYTLTIKNAQNGDTGNYSASTKDGNMTVSVNVTSEPTEIYMKLNDEMVNMTKIGQRSDLPRKVLELNRVYKLECVAGKGNPFPHVNITSGDMAIPVVYEYNTSRVPEDSFSARVERQTTATVKSWKFGIEYVGKPLKCQAGAFQPSNLEIEFMPIITDPEPIFYCVDEVHFASDKTDVNITCQIYSSSENMNELYVHWAIGKNMTLKANLGRGRYQDNQQSTDDHRISLKTTSPHAHEMWWTMMLKIESPNRVENLPGTQFTFVAVNQEATTTHVVTLKKEGHDGREDGDGAGLMSRLSMSMLLTVLAVTLGLSQQ